MVFWLLLTLIAAVCYGSSIILQKIALTGKKNLLEAVKNPLLLVGASLMLTGGALFLKALSMGEVSVVSPLLNLNVIVTWAFGKVVLGEKCERIEWLGLALLLSGSFLLSMV